MGSVWQEVARRAPHPALDGDKTTDVLVIGGGMAGILTAHRLQQAGVSCLVAEAKTVGSGITKNTTAKITAQHGLIYADLLRRSGAEKARQYLDANTRAVEAFRAMAGQISCDFEEKTAYVYSTDDRRKLELEAQSYQALGLPARIREDAPLPFRTVGALAMERQAQFHPLKLLYALADGLNIVENTFVRAIDGHTAITDTGRIKARHIVLATHFPLVNIPGLYFIKLYQHRSYVLALEGAPLPDGMYVDERQDGHSFRSYQDLLFVGGGDHKTGKKGGEFAELQWLSEMAYPRAVPKYRWATQDCMSLDAVPYIGLHRTGAQRLYVATGFNKWGMTGSMVAAELLRDLIISGRSELAPLYSPQRSLLTGQLFLNLGGAVAGLASIGGPRCAHMGCKLHRNAAEGTWDCSCHGSRFDKDGHVIDNPAKKGIRP